MIETPLLTLLRPLSSPRNLDTNKFRRPIYLTKVEIPEEEALLASLRNDSNSSVVKGAYETCHKKSLIIERDALREGKNNWFSMKMSVLACLSGYGFLYFSNSPKLIPIVLIPVSSYLLYLKLSDYYRRDLDAKYSVLLGTLNKNAE